MHRKLTVWILGWVLAAGVVLAESEGSRMVVGGSGSTTNPTVITSERLSYDYKRSMAIFEEHVIVDDPKIRMECDELRVIFNKTNQLKSVTAIGHVKMTSEDKVATCNKAVYQAEIEEVNLIGNAKLSRQGRESVTGDRVIYYLNDERISVIGATELVIPSGAGGGGVDLKKLKPSKGGTGTGTGDGSGR